jgi:hypothetical protein
MKLMEEKMDFKLRITHLCTIPITFALLLLFMPFTDAAFSAEEEKSLYLIHVSSFKNQKDAEVEISKLLEQDLQAFYRSEAVEGKGDWFRVFIGTFENRQAAKAKGAELKNKGIISYAAPRKVKPDFIPERKTAEAEKIADEPIEPLITEEEPPIVEVPQKAEEPVKPPVVEKEPPPVEVPPEPVAKPIEKTVQKSPAPEKKIATNKEKKVEHKPNGESSLEKSKFSLALNAGVYSSSSAEDFTITELALPVSRNFSFNGNAYQIAIEPSMSIYKDLDLYGRLEYVFVDDVDILFISFGPKLRFNLSDSVFSYIKGGLVRGDFSYDIAPGEFDDDFGYEGGFGLAFLKTPYKIGLDLLYRDIEFGYISPDNPAVTTNDSSINVSGLSMSGTITFYF